MENLHLLTDDSLLTLFIEGKNAAFEVLLSRYEIILHNYIGAIVHREDAVSDILQETYVRALSTIRKGGYEETGRFKSWIMRIAHNCMVDYCRRETSDWSFIHDSPEGDLFNDVRFCDETVEDKMIRLQILQNVKHLLRFLPVAQREIVYLRLYKELSFKEIASLTGVSINTALGRMRYAILNMRKIVRKNQNYFVMS
ncbi:MAG: sigma-70 family RNA polymerase sigma factor [Tannerellaceae bacterium]|nr:sigma-70 family RNA polymerase sigma factor [Tannerellaceae bacterium]